MKSTRNNSEFKSSTKFTDKRKIIEAKNSRGVGRNGSEKRNRGKKVDGDDDDDGDVEIIDIGGGGDDNGGDVDNDSGCEDGGDDSDNSEDHGDDNSDCDDNSEDEDDDMVCAVCCLPITSADHKETGNEMESDDASTQSSEENIFSSTSEKSWTGNFPEHSISIAISENIPGPFLGSHGMFLGKERKGGVEKREERKDERKDKVRMMTGKGETTRVGCMRCCRCPLMYHTSCVDSSELAFWQSISGDRKEKKKEKEKEEKKVDGRDLKWTCPVCVADESSDRRRSARNRNRK